MADRSLPQFFIMGAPKAGTTALHAALAQHPQLYLSPVKEPKYYLCDDRRPPADEQRGPGDAHSAREWIWRRSDYQALFADAPQGTIGGESTPFYLWSKDAHVRIHRDVPDARLVVIVRDPVDRAYSNWQHLWSDGLEPISDFLQACDAEEDRIANGYAPFWRYRDLGRYGSQLQHLLELFDRDQVHVLRYRQLVDEPAATLDAICEFLGVAPTAELAARPENVKLLAPDDLVTRAVAQNVRLGATVGAFLPSQWWRQASRPLLWALHRRGEVRPELTASQRAAVREPLVDDIELLSRILDQPFDDWLGATGRGAFATRSESVAR